MATNLAIDDELIDEARRVGSHSTKNQAVTVELQEYVARRKQLAVLDLFGSHDIPCSTCDLVVAELKEGASELGKLLTALLMAEVNIHGCYSLLTRPRGNTALALHVEDNECATAVLRSHGFRLLDQPDISR